MHLNRSRECAIIEQQQQQEANEREDPAGNRYTLRARSEPPPGPYFRPMRHAFYPENVTHPRARASTPPTPLSMQQRQQARRPHNSLLYFTAIQGDQPLEDDDNFSTISEHQVRDYNIPNELMGVDENEVSRPDGRQQQHIAFIQDMVTARLPPAPRRRWFFERPVVFAYRLFGHILNWYTISLFVMAISYCHGGQCIGYVNHFFTDTDKLE